MPASEKAIFFDPSQRRARTLRRAGRAVLTGAGALLVLFIASIIAVPIAHRLLLPRPHRLPDNPTRTGNAALPPRPLDLTGRRLATRSADHTAAANGVGNGVVGGFYVDWDETSLASLKQHASELTHLFPGWLHLDDAGAKIVATDHDPSDDAAREIAARHRLAVLPVLNNFSANKNDFDEARLHALLIDPKKRAALADSLLDYTLRHRYAGVCLDLETEDDADRERLAGFVAEVAARLRPRGLLVTSCTQVGDIDQAAAIARPCDFVIPMIYDLHYASGSAGPIAPEDWAVKELDSLLTRVPAAKIVLAIGNYAYDWHRGRVGATTLTFGEAMVTARESQGDSGEGVLKVDKASANPTFVYSDDDGPHEVWLLDALTAWNLMRAAQKRGVSGRALWYVGSEDPTLWSFFGRGKTPDDPSALRLVHYGFEIDFEGEGEALDIAAMASDGERELVSAADGRLTSETFTRYPAPCVVRRSGKAEKTIALTFDDGPDPQFTPPVLDALKKAGIPGTFFVIGVHVEQYPALVRRIFDEGHDIGNHSFYHPNLAEVGEGRATLEIDATQRAIQSATLHASTLFRPPYGIDAQPATAAEIIPIALANRLGYVTVAEGIDPRDWETGPRRRSAAQIADDVVAEAVAGAHADSRWRGNIVLLHDAGGDRSETVKAIPLIASRLKAAGFRFVTVSQLLGQSRASAMPALSGQQLYVALADRLVFETSATAGRILAAIFLFSITAGTLRLLATALLALRHAALAPPVDEVAPPLGGNGRPLTASVVIAAYNEAAVIGRTVSTLLRSDFPALEVVVIDDGSRDATAEAARTAAGDDTRVRVLTQTNAGKAAAMNYGVASSTGAVVLGLDADTLFETTTVSRLMRHFADERVGAAAGNILVGNRVNTLTRWQAVEYVTSQNFDRRAYAVLNAIPVIPGCVGAWRRDALIAAGGYRTDTLAEDADLTWRVRQGGWRLVCDSDARAYTEAPERLGPLLRQRFRWTFGTLQNLWKHRDMVLRARYGWFGMVVVPGLWVFQVLLPLCAPAADLGVLTAAIGGQIGAAAAYFAFFFALELGAAHLAYTLDGSDRERRRDVSWLIVQRVVYRYLLFVILWRAMSAALSGIRASWDKLERTGRAALGSAR